MSRDSKPLDKVDTVPTITTSDKSSQTQALAVDTAEQIRRAAIERRSQSVVHGAFGPVAELGYERYVLPGFKAGYINPAGDKCNILYSRGFDFVKDLEGKNCTLKANNDRNANEHVFYYMQAPAEIYDEEIRESTRQSRARFEEQDISDPSLPVTSRMRTDPFFHDLGLNEDND